MQNIGSDWGFLNNPGCWLEVLEYLPSTDLRLMSLVNSKLNKLITNHLHLHQRREETLIGPKIWRILSTPKIEHFRHTAAGGEPSKNEGICNAIQRISNWKILRGGNNGKIAFTNPTTGQIWKTNLVRKKYFSLKIHGDFCTLMRHVKAENCSYLDILHLPTRNQFDCSNLTLQKEFHGAPKIIYHGGEYKILFGEPVDFHTMEEVRYTLITAGIEEPESKKIKT